MQYTKTRTIDKQKTSRLAFALVFGGIAAGLPFMIHAQWLTGPIINALLILALFVAGLRAAIIISFVPSVMALSGGLLPAVLAPTVPFIILSNVLFVSTINFISKRFKIELNGYIVSTFISSMLKFIFLVLSVNIVAKFLINNSLAEKAAKIMSWPQFYTALAGSVIAFVVLRFLKKI